MSNQRIRKRDDNKKLPWGTISGIFLTVVIIAGALSLWISNRDTPQTPPSEPEPASSSECPTATAEPVALPVGGPTSWNIITVGPGLAIPQNDVYGPSITAGISHCFNPGSSGALFAAANFSAWFASGEDMLAVVQTITYADESQSEWIAEIQARCGTTSGQCAASSGQQMPTIVAYKGEQVSPERVNITLVHDAQPGTGKWAIMQLPLKWDGTDWKIMMPVAGPFTTAWIDSLDGYTPWRIQ